MSPSDHKQQQTVTFCGCIDCILTNTNEFFNIRSNELLVNSLQVVRSPLTSIY